MGLSPVNRENERTVGISLVNLADGDAGGGEGGGVSQQSFLD